MPDVAARTVAIREHRGYGPPLPDRVNLDRYLGASPSGKAVDFDSTIRRFESSRPSHNPHPYHPEALTVAGSDIGAAVDSRMASSHGNRTGSPIGGMSRWPSRAEIAASAIVCIG